jgi:hypothetical protein
LIYIYIYIYLCFLFISLFTLHLLIGLGWRGLLLLLIGVWIGYHILFLYYIYIYIFHHYLTLILRICLGGFIIDLVTLSLFGKHVGLCQPFRFDCCYTPFLLPLLALFYLEILHDQVMPYASILFLCILACSFLLPTIHKITEYHVLSQGKRII